MRATAAQSLGSQRHLPASTAAALAMCVRPCDKSSLAPTAQALEEPWKLHFARASALYLSLSNGALPPTLPAQVSTRNSTQKRSGSSGEALDAMIAQLPRAPVVTDPHEERDEQPEHAHTLVLVYTRARTHLGNSISIYFNSCHHFIQDCIQF